MNHLEFNKPHIQQKLRNSWAIETIQAAQMRVFLMIISAIENAEGQYYFNKNDRKSVK